MRLPCNQYKSVETTAWAMLLKRLPNVSPPLRNERDHGIKQCAGHAVGKINHPIVLPMTISTFDKVDIINSAQCCPLVELLCRRAWSVVVMVKHFPWGLALGTAAGSVSFRPETRKLLVTDSTNSTGKLRTTSSFMPCSYVHYCFNFNVSL